MRILSSAEKCRRVARRIFFTTSVAGSFSSTDFCLIFAPCEGYDEPEILPSSTHPICLMSADGGHRLLERSGRCARAVQFYNDTGAGWGEGVLLQLECPRAACVAEKLDGSV